jgi:hypothetical protein
MVLAKVDSVTPSKQNGSNQVLNGQNGTGDWNKKGSVIQKPQKQFQDKIDNSFVPFLPKIRQKPNALTPLSGKAILNIIQTSII